MQKLVLMFAAAVMAVSASAQTLSLIHILLLLHCLADHQVALLEIGRDKVFVADAYHLEVERSRICLLYTSPITSARQAFMAGTCGLSLGRSAQTVASILPSV